MAGPVDSDSASPLTPTHSAPLHDFESSLRPHLHERTSSASSTGWHFPGPSSKYHQRERAITTQSRSKPPSTVSVGPVLTTEKRAAHRRVRSYHEARRGVLSPPSSEYGAANVRSPLSRFASYTRDAMDVGGGTAVASPVTPAKSPRMRSSSLLQDSPFSDYFSSDARSLPQEVAVSKFDPESEDAKHTQALLVRLSKLQSQLMRGENGAEALYLVERKMNEVEMELVAMHSQSRLPAEMEDSGLFMDGAEDVPKEGSPNGKHWIPALPFTGLDGVMESPPGSPTPDSKHDSANGALDYSEVEEGVKGAHDHDRLLHEAQEVLKAVTAAQKQLRQRHEDLKELNEVHAMQIEEREQQLLELQSENEALRSDLGFDHSELLFLKLQMKALEVEVSGGSEDDSAGHSIDRKHHDTVLEELDRWRSDWMHVNARFRHRREKYGVVEKARRDSSLEDNFEVKKDEAGQWRLETVRKDSGRRVQSITISRTNSQDVSTTLSSTIAEESEDEQANEKDSRQEQLQGRRLSYSEHATQTDEPSRGIQAEDMATRYDSDSLFDDDDSEEENDTPKQHEDDCAITTSSEADADELEAVTQTSTKSAQPFVRTAWQELWEGMADMVGMGDDRFD